MSKNASKALDDFVEMFREVEEELPGKHQVEMEKLLETLCQQTEADRSLRIEEDKRTRLLNLIFTYPDRFTIDDRQLRQWESFLKEHTGHGGTLTEMITIVDDVDDLDDDHDQDDQTEPVRLRQPAQPIGVPTAADMIRVRDNIARQQRDEAMRNMRMNNTLTGNPWAINFPQPQGTMANPIQNQF